MGMRKCSQCGETGHNSRTCRRIENGQSMKLFGVELVSLPSSDDHGVRKSFNLGSAQLMLSSYDEDCDKLRNRYFETNHAHTRKGVPWSEEEHRLFVLGLEKLGKGDWRGISRNYVTTRTSTQVASHAQKYFLRLKNKLHNNKPILPYMVGRKESVGSFPTTATTKPMPNLRLFNNNQISPSLELSLASPQPPSLWDRRPVVHFWRKSMIVSK